MQRLEGTDNVSGSSGDLPRDAQMAHEVQQG